MLLSLNSVFLFCNHRVLSNWDSITWRIESALIDAEIKLVTLHTAEDGDVEYQFDTDTKLPISAEDERAKIMGVYLTFLPKRPGDPLEWAIGYEIKFKKVHWIRCKKGSRNESIISS